MSLEKSAREIELELALVNLLSVSLGYRNVIVRMAGKEIEPHEVEQEVFSECRRLLGFERYKALGGVEV